MIRWGDPTYLVAAALILPILAVAFALDFTRRRRLLVAPSAALLLRMAASASPGRRALKAVLVVVAALLLVLALARPQVEGPTRWQQRGFDVALVVDVSRSMLARDVYPSRLARARLAAAALMDGLGSGDRLAVVAFAGGHAHYPLTTDHEAARRLLEALEPEDVPGGSDLGAAILRARCLLRPGLPGAGCEGPSDGASPASEVAAAKADEGEGRPAADEERGRALVIFTDGEDTVGRSRAEIERAARLGIEVFLVGIGTREGAAVPPPASRGGALPEGAFATAPHVSRLEEGALRTLASLSEGRVYTVGDDTARLLPEEMTLALDELKRGDLSRRVVKGYQEAYQWLLFPAFLLLVIEACVPDRRRTRAPRRARAAEGQA